jgi:2-oxo-hept-3-ene-1,7-dioate hydratase
MTPAQIAQAAQSLFDAEKTGTQRGLLSIEYPDITLDDAYAVQAALVSLKRESGLVIRGWKIGLTSRAMQAALNIETPDSGVLLDNMLFDNGGRVAADRFIQPRVEAEIAFIMKRDLDADRLDLHGVMDATEYVCPALEILDTRILRSDPDSGRTRTIHDTVADNAANAGIVLGGNPMDPAALDLARVGVVLSRNACIEETGLGAGVLGHPAQGIVWLARRLAQYGQQIKAGEIVISGSFIRPVEAPHGSTIHADYGDFGNVSIFFE